MLLYSLLWTKRWGRFRYIRNWHPDKTDSRSTRGAHLPLYKMAGGYKKKSGQTMERSLENSLEQGFSPNTNKQGMEMAKKSARSDKPGNPYRPGHYTIPHARTGGSIRFRKGGNKQPIISD